MEWKTGHVQAGLATPLNKTSASTASRFLVLTTRGNYNTEWGQSNRICTLLDLCTSWECKAYPEAGGWSERSVGTNLAWWTSRREGSRYNWNGYFTGTPEGKNNDCQIWFVSRTPWTKSPRDLQKSFLAPDVNKVTLLYKQQWRNSSRNWYRVSYKALLSKNNALPPRFTKSNPIHTMSGILETLMIRHKEDLNGPIINLPTHTRSTVSRPPTGRSWLSWRIGLSSCWTTKQPEFIQRFFDKAYEIRAAAGLQQSQPYLKLIDKDPSLDLVNLNANL